jgi:uncharacterized lipoprotein YehR (DUF1307 family)
MKKLAFPMFVVLAFSLMVSGLVMAAGKPSEKSQKLTAEVVSVDPIAKTITFKDDKGESRSATAVKKAALYIRNLNPGDKAVLTCRQDDKGDIKQITNFKTVKK